MSMLVNYFVVITISAYYVSEVLVLGFYVIFTLTSFLLFFNALIDKQKLSKKIILLYVFLFSYIDFQFIYSTDIYNSIEIPHSSIAYLSSMIFSFALYINKIKKNILCWGMLLGAIFNGVLIYYDVFSSGWGIVRASGGKVEVNSVALLQCLGIASAYVLMSQKRIALNIFALFLSILIPTVLMTGSRSGMISLSFLLFFIFYLERGMFKQRKFVFISSIVSLISLYFLGDTLIKMLGSNIEYLVGRFLDPTAGDMQSLKSRWDEILVAIDFLASNPLVILGGTFPGYTDNMFWSQTQEYIRIHNTYFALIVENGFISILSLVFFAYLGIARKNRYYFTMMLPVLLSSMAIYSLYLFPVFVAFASSILDD